MTLSLSTDKTTPYAPGEQVQVTAVYDDNPPTTFMVTVTATATDPSGTVPAETASTTYSVQPVAPAVKTVVLADNAGGVYTQQSNAPGTSVFAAVAPAAPPAPVVPSVPSGFSGAEPGTALLSGITTLSFGGHEWEVENWGTGNGQPVASQAVIDANGYLELTASDIAAGYRGAELDSARGDMGLAGNTSTWGYGSYEWVIGTDLSTMPPGLVLGFFSFWATSKGGPAGQKEIDFELGTLGVAPSPICQMGFYQDTAAVVTAGVPPYHTLVTGSQVALKSAPVTTLQLIWLPDHITWNMWYGTSTAGAPDVTLTMTQGQKYTYTQPFGGNAFSGTVNIPASGKQQVIMNLWLAGGSPVPATPFTAVIRSFNYTPSS